MNSNEHPLNERQAFDELLGDDRFDDSVSDRHYSDLRSKVLQAFDHPSSDATVVELHVPSIGKRQDASWNRSLGYAVILAVCLVGLVATWFYQGTGSDDHQIVNDPPIPDVAVDSRYLAALDQVNAYRDEVSPEELFAAIAMCELDHEGRMMFDSVQP